MYIDTHAHFDICIKQTKYDENTLLAEMQKAGVEYAVQVSTEQTDFDWCRKFAGKYEHIYFTLGIHPSSEFTDKDLEKLADFADQVNSGTNAHKLFGIGEAGLDYYWMKHSRERQINLFETQINIAKQYNLPIIVHTRDAMQDTIDVLKSNSIEKGVIHCFSGTKSEAAKLLDMGFHISFAGNVTFKKCTDLQEVAVYVPEDRLFFETDCPYLTPVPKRGKKNRPDYVAHTYEFVANLRKQPVKELAIVIKNNFIALLNK